MTTLEQRISRMEGACERLATKNDVERVRIEVAGVSVDVAEVRSDNTNGRAELKTEIADLRTEMRERFTQMETNKTVGEANFLPWFVGLIAVNLATVASSIASAVIGLVG